MSVYLGIDPGATMGLALYNSETRHLQVWPGKSFWEAHEIYHDLAVQYRAELIVILEWPPGNPPVFDRGVRGRKAAKIAQNVGGNKRDAQLWAEYFEREKQAFENVTPRSRKWDAETFRRLTGHKGRTSQHARDAAKLVWGR